MQVLLQFIQYSLTKRFLAWKFCEEVRNSQKQKQPPQYEKLHVCIIAQKVYEGTNNKLKYQLVATLRKYHLHLASTVGDCALIMSALIKTAYDKEMASVYSFTELLNKSQNLIS